MLLSPPSITPLHLVYVFGVIVILSVMICRRDTPAVCIGFLFLLGCIGLKSFYGGIQVVFRSILYASTEFMEVIVTIAAVTSLSKCLADVGSDYIMMKPMTKIMKTPSLTWWILGFTMMVFALFLWPSPSVALVGAILIPVAVQAGIQPLFAAMAINLFGHGIALSYDGVIQGAPAISARAAQITTGEILIQGRPLFLTMSAVTVISAYLLNRKSMTATHLVFHNRLTQKKYLKPSKPAIILAAVTPLTFLFDIIIMVVFNLKGTDATSIVSGSAILLTCFGAFISFKKQFLEKFTDYVTEGFLFAIRIFAPVIIIGAFFFLGGDGISEIMEKSFQTGIISDWAVWIACHAPLNKYFAVLIQMLVGGLTGLDGSGFSGLPLTGSLARTFGTALGVSVPVFASLGQICAIFVGGGTIIPWGLIPVAAICNVDPIDLARKNIVPVFIGFFFTFIAACLLL